MNFFLETKNKKVAVGLFGISRRKQYKHWMGWNTDIDWRKSNYKETILKTLLESNNTVDHYFSTYHSDTEEELLDSLKPIAYKFNDFSCNTIDNSWVIDRHRRFQETIGLFPSDYDYYIMTRFDLWFNPETLPILNFDNSGINVTSKHGCGEDTELSCDYFYIFDNKMLEPFKKFINNLPPPANEDICYYHKLARYENSPKFCYLLDGYYYSHNCPLWRILR